MRWNLDELFDDSFKKELRKKIISLFFRFLRIFILLVIFVQYFYFGVTPTKSMLPTIEENDLAIYLRNAASYERGDIISFSYPYDETISYQKRIVGLSGETIEIKDEQVYIDGVPLNEPYILEAPDYTYEKVLIPDGYVFVLGDNRNNSEDSSYFGPVKTDSIRGKIIFILLPLNHFGPIH